MSNSEEQLDQHNQHDSKDQSAHSMRANILHSIRSGNIIRKPKWRYVLQTIFATIGVILVLLAAIYLASAVFFALRVNGAWFLPTLGFAGFRPFLRSLPWVLLVLSVIFVIILYTLVKRYAFAYGRPFLYSALAIVIVVAGSSVLVGLTSFHQGVFQRAHDGRLPFPGSPLYENFGQQPHDVTIGVINSIGMNTWQITSHEGKTYTVILGPQVQVPQNATIGDEVVILGEREDSTIKAVGIEPLVHNGNAPIQNVHTPYTPTQPPALQTY